MSVFLPPSLPFKGSYLPTGTCLVGGAVRDSFLERYKQPFDLDLILPERAIATAAEIARVYQGGFVILDRERQIARVVFAEGTVDFAQMQGGSLETDLGLRDFTINAIAYDLTKQQILDPLGGIKDLQEGRITMISPQNLQSDPLRLFRAYRFATQLNFTIETNTQLTIRSLASLLKRVAGERVQRELTLLLEAPRSSVWLKQAWQDEILQVWLTADGVELLPAIEKISLKLESDWPQLPWQNIISPQAKLASLVSPLPETAKTELSNLKYSRLTIKAITNTVKYLPQLLTSKQPLSLKEQYFFFLHVGAQLPIVAVLALAKGISSDWLYPLIARYCDLQDPVAHPQPLLTGEQLMEHLQLKPGPQIAELLTAIQLAYIEGKISSPAQGLQLAESQL